jgi:signal transduction histidine kinase
MAERERLARALHDDIGQTLTAVGLQLELLRMDSGPEAAARVAGIQRLLEQAIERVRELSRQLRAGVQ